MKVKVENIVASTALGQKIDLEFISAALSGAEYEPEQFPGLVFRLKEPKVTSLMFMNGKIICAGAKSVEDVETAIERIVRKLRTIGVDVDDPSEIIVQNIVATASVGANLNLDAVAIAWITRSTSRSSSPASCTGCPIRRSFSCCSALERW